MKAQRLRALPFCYEGEEAPSGPTRCSANSAANFAGEANDNARDSHRRAGFLRFLRFLRCSKYDPRLCGFENNFTIRNPGPYQHQQRLRQQMAHFVCDPCCCFLLLCILIVDIYRAASKNMQGERALFGRP